MHGCEGISGSYIVSVPSVESVASVRRVEWGGLGWVGHSNEVVCIPIRSSSGYCLVLGLDSKDHVDVNDTDERQYCSVNAALIENREQ